MTACICRACLSLSSVGANSNIEFQMDNAATRSESARDQAGGRATANLDQLGRSSPLSRARCGNQWSGRAFSDGFGRGLAVDWCRRRPDRRRRDCRSLVASDAAAVRGSQVVAVGQMAVPPSPVVVLAGRDPTLPATTIFAARQSRPSSVSAATSAHADSVTHSRASDRPPAVTGVKQCLGMRGG